jgi:hypothetical protein
MALQASTTGIIMLNLVCDEIWYLSAFTFRFAYIIHLSRKDLPYVS